jgi:hypothetical protein
MVRGVNLWFPAKEKKTTEEKVYEASTISVLPSLRH